MRTRQCNPAVNLASVLLVLAGGAGAPWARAEEPSSTILIEDGKLHGDGGGGGPGAPGDAFGWSVAVDGETAIVAAPWNDYHGSGVGLVYVFVRSGGAWVEQQRLAAVDPGQTWFFGSSVALSGGTALVGAGYDHQLGSGAGAAYVFVRDGATWIQQQKLVAADGAAGDRFGWKVALSGDVAVLGSPNDGDAGTDSGAAYVFVRSGEVWTQRQKLTAGDAAQGDQFGGAVAVSGDTALVGARLGGDAGLQCGSAYVFVDDGGTWVEQQKLIAADAAESDEFGRSVALAGDTALVGATGGGATASGSGSAYVFVRSGGTWSQQAELGASDASPGDGFGESVALSGERAAVGSWRAFGTNPGAAYVFDRIGEEWSEQAKLVAEEVTADDHYGSSVSLSGAMVIIGAPHQDAAGAFSGAAYAYVSAGGPWTLEQQLLGDATAAFDYFGFSLAASGDTLLVSAPHDGGGFESGSTYVFVRSGAGWVVEQKLAPSVQTADDWFGWWVALREDIAVVGAPSDVDGGVQGGAAYVFARTGGVWTQQQKLLASDAQPDAQFGSVVALSTDPILVTADESDGSGSVYVFGLSGGDWVEQQKLRAPQPVAGDYFGSSIAVDGDTALIGACGDDEAAPDAGAVYVFEQSGGLWLQTQKLMAADAAEGDGLGWPTLSGDTALIGAGGADGGAGAVYVFEREGDVWVERQRLTPADPEPGASFGVVSLDGDLAVVGAGGSSCAVQGSGAAYLFERRGGEWVQRHKLCASDGSSIQWFGFPLALAAGTVVVGAPADDDDGWRSGSVYLFSAPLFTDGFESGDSTAWSTTEP